MTNTSSRRHLVFFGFLLLFAMIFLFRVPVDSVFAASLTPTPTETPADKNITKEDSAPAIKLNVKSKALVKGKTFALKVYNMSEGQKVSYKSNSADIASVDENGLVTGLDFGSAVITVTIKDNSKTAITITCEITVGPPAISVKWTKSELILAVGKRTTLKTILQPNNTLEEAKFLSADTSVATVSTGGRITAKSIGNTVIYVLLDNGKFDCCTITVVDEETYQKLTSGKDDSTIQEPDDSDLEDSK